MGGNFRPRFLKKSSNDWAEFCIYNKISILDNEKRNIFFEQVKIEANIKWLNLATADELKEIDFHIQLRQDGFEPEDVPLDSEWDPNYWDDEDPDA